MLTEARRPVEAFNFVQLNKIEVDPVRQAFDLARRLAKAVSGVAAFVMELRQRLPGILERIRNRIGAAGGTSVNSGLIQLRLF